MKDRATVKEQFAGTFTADHYDGSYHDESGFRTAASDEASSSFSELTGGLLQWSQVHGNVKDVVRRAMFEPYPHWSELYDCCKRVIKEHVALNREFSGDVTRARLMGDAMALLKAKYGKNAPKCWLPIMKSLRHSKENA
jgi:hypothetical protein